VGDLGLKVGMDLLHHAYVVYCLHCFLLCLYYNFIIDAAAG